MSLFLVAAYPRRRRAPSLTVEPRRSLSPPPRAFPPRPPHFGAERPGLLRRGGRRVPPPRPLSGGEARVERGMVMTGSQTHARVLIVGGGAAGISVAAR